jgi:hypothetical protein
MPRIRLKDGLGRMLTVHEGARTRLQGFPDWFEFQGELSEQFDRIGNAAPTRAILCSDPASEKIEQAVNVMKAAGVPVRDLTRRRTELLAPAVLGAAHLKRDEQGLGSAPFGRYSNQPCVGFAIP